MELQCSFNPTVAVKTQSFLESKGIDWSTLTSEQKINIVNKLECACKSCPLKYEATPNAVPSQLRADSKFLFIGRNPNKSEGMQGKLFPEGVPQGEIFRKYLDFLGIGPYECSIINMCNCTSGGNRPITSDEVSKCSYLTWLAMNSLDNIEYIFPLGQDAMKWVFGKTINPMQTLGEYFQLTYNSKPVTVIPLPHPSMLMANREIGNSVKEVLTDVKSRFLT